MPEGRVPPIAYIRVSGPVAAASWFRAVGKAATTCVGKQEQTLGIPPPPQVSSPLQAGPQVTVPPHPSGIVPQLSGAGQVVFGTQPQTLAVPPPPQVCPV